MRVTPYAVFLFVSPYLLGQSSDTAFSFEVASIRPHEGPLRTIHGFSSSGPLVRLEGYQLMGLIMEAYNLKSYQVQFAAAIRQPDTTYYDIVAKAEDESARTRQDFRPLLQTLLTSRFDLKLHRDLQEQSVYALTVSKAGLKLSESPGDAVFSSRTDVRGRNQVLAATKASMDFLTQAISNNYFVDRPVIDATALAGNYDVRLEATPDFTLRNGSEIGDISIFDALQRQLGLKLESSKMMIEILVVDSVQKPSAN